MSSFKDYFTRPAHNTAIRITIAAPDGSGGEAWLDMVGAESDRFRAARELSEHELLASLAKIENVDDRKKFIADQKQASRLKMLASLVVAWSFDEECTPENVILLLTEAPFIADEIDRKSASTKDFLAKKLTNSPNTPEQSST